VRKLRRSSISTALAALLVGVTPTFASGGAEVVSRVTLPDISLKTISNTALANSVANDQGVLLGGIGSDLFHSPHDPIDIFYAITDRGPNNDTVQPDKSAGTGFVVPDFTPLIVKLRITKSGVEILETKAIVTRTGAGVTGLPNIKGYDAVPTNTAGIPSDALYNVAGQDSEGIVRLRDGQFWIVDEYAPSVTNLRPNGAVKTRYVPQGWAGKNMTYKIDASIPAIYLKRKANRGFEALALSPDETRLFIGLQSPLLNPSSTVGNASLVTRILEFDLQSKTFVGEYAFGFEKASVVDATSTKASDLKLSSIVALSNDTLLVQERTDNSFLLSTITLTKNANILNSKWDLATTTPSLETYSGAGTNSEVEALLALNKKKMVFDSATIKDMPMKIEGVAVLDKNHIIVVNDNDFNFKFNTATAKVENGTVKTSFLTIKLPTALPTTPEAELARLGGACVSLLLEARGLQCRSDNGSVNLRWRNPKTP